MTDSLCYLIALFDPLVEPLQSISLCTPSVSHQGYIDLMFSFGSVFYGKLKLDTDEQSTKGQGPLIFQCQNLVPLL